MEVKMPRFINDTKIPELKIRKTCYAVSFRFNNKKEEHKIGSLSMPINVARKEVQKILGLVAQGINPFEEKKKKQEADEYIVDKMWGKYIKSLKHKNQDTDQAKKIYKKKYRTYFW